MSLPSLPPVLRHELQLLPPGIGLPILHLVALPNDRQLTSTFALLSTMGRSFVGKTLRVEHLQPHWYDSTLFLEMHLSTREAYEVVSTSPPVILFLSPHLHHHTCQKLCDTDHIQLVTYDAPSYTPLEQISIPWREPFRHEMTQLMQTYPMPSTPFSQSQRTRVRKETRVRWHQFLTQWKRDTIKHTTVTDIQASLTPTSSLTPRQQTEVGKSSLQALQKSTVPPAVMDVAQLLLHEQHTDRKTFPALRWYLAPSKIVEGILLVSSELVWNRATLVFQEPHYYSYPEGPLVVLPYLLQGQGISKQAGNVLLCPAREYDRQVLHYLSQQTGIMIYGMLPHDQTVQYLGKHRYTFLTSKRRAILSRPLLGTKVNPSVDWNRVLARHQMNQVLEKQQKEREQEEQQRWHLPTNWREAFQSSKQQAALLLSTQEQTPVLLLALPAGIDIAHLQIHLPALNIFRYSSGRLAICLHIHLVNADNSILPLDLLLHPFHEQKCLRQLARLEHLTVLLVDTTSHPYWSISDKLSMPWPRMFRSRLHRILEETFHKPRILATETQQAWQALIDEHARIFPPTTMFHPPTQLPHRITQNLPLREPTRSSGQSATTSLSPSPSKDINEPLPASKHQERLDSQVSRSTNALSQPTPEMIQHSLLARVLWSEYAQLPMPNSIKPWMRSTFWRTFLYFALQQAAPFSWEKDALDIMPATINLAEQTSLPLSPQDRPPLPPIPPQFPRLHLWIQFPQPLPTPVGSAHGILLVAAHDTRVFEALANYYALSPAEKRQLRTQIYHEEQGRLLINLFANDGRLFWAMSLPLHRPASEVPIWYASPWATCPEQACRFDPHLGIDKKTITFTYSPCQRCAQTQYALGTWIKAAWHALQGEYRPQDLESLPFLQRDDDLSEDIVFPEEAASASPQLRPYRFRVIRRMDIMTSLPQREHHPPHHKRGSWIERRLQEDPDAIVREERLIRPRRLRKLKHKRFERYRQKHGTDKLKVKPYIKEIPLLREGMTRISAETHHQGDEEMTDEKHQT